MAGDIRDRCLRGEPVVLTGLFGIVLDPVHDQVDAYDHQHIAYESKASEKCFVLLPHLYDLLLHAAIYI